MIVDMSYKTREDVESVQFYWIESVPLHFTLSWCSQPGEVSTNKWRAKLMNNFDYWSSSWHTPDKIGHTSSSTPYHLELLDWYLRSQPAYNDEKKMFSSNRYRNTKFLSPSGSMILISILPVR